MTPDQIQRFPLAFVAPQRLALREDQVNLLALAITSCPPGDRAEALAQIEATLQKGLAWANPDASGQQCSVAAALAVGAVRRRVRQVEAHEPSDGLGFAATGSKATN